MVRKNPSVWSGRPGAPHRCFEPIVEFEKGLPQVALVPPVDRLEKLGLEIDLVSG